MKHRLLALAAAGALCLSLCGFSGEQPLPDTITVQGTGLVEARSRTRRSSPPGCG